MSPFKPFPSFHSEDPFQFRIATVDPGETFTIPLTDVEPGHNFLVDWGDGSSDVITTYNDPLITHTYVDPGSYLVAIKGRCSGLQVNWYGDCLKITEVVSWGDVGFKRLDFGGCTNLTTLPSEMGKLTEVTSFENAFAETGITVIPEGLFYGNKVATSFVYCFGVTQIPEVPAHSFDENIAATDFTSCFYGSLIATIPAGVFRHNVNVLSFSACFQNCPNLTTLPVDIFRYNTLVTSFNSTFDGCGLATLPNNLFYYNTLVSDYYRVLAGNPLGDLSGVTGIFGNNAVVTEIQYPFTDSGVSAINVDLLSGLTSLTSGRIFYRAQSLTTVPADTFRYNTAMVSFYETFYESGLNTIPAGLFDYNTSAIEFYSTFGNSYSLTTAPPGLFRLNTLATTFTQIFLNCEALKLEPWLFYSTGEQGTRFLNQYPGFYRCFYRTNWTGAIAGTAPDLWACDFGSGSPQGISECFSSVYPSMTNESDIPPQWGGPRLDMAIAPRVLDSIYVRWTSNVYGVTGYKVKYGTTTGVYTTTTDVGLVNEYTVTSLTDSQEYFFVVVAYGISGDLKTSTEVSAVTATSLFQFTIQTNGLVTLPVGGVDLMVYWGDELPSEHITSNSPTHTYTSAGSYDITLVGSCASFANHYNMNITAITDIADLGFTTLNFAGCSSLGSVPDSITSLTHLEVAWRLFMDCSSLTAIPSGIFDNSPDLYYFMEAFKRCTSLETVPDNLLQYNPEALYFNNMFNECTKLKVNPTIFYAPGEETTRFLNKSPDFSYCFARHSFSGEQGTAPNLWACSYGTGTPTKTACFWDTGNSSTSLDNYASIPTAWKQ